MEIVKDRMVQLEFELRDDSGKLLDASTAADPVSYLHGRGDLVPGLESHLEGKKVGEEFEVVVPPKDGFGEREEARTFEVPKKEFGDSNPHIGMMFTMQTPEGIGIPVTVTKVKPSTVVLDPNHVFSGLNLHFKGRVLGVRDANKDELRGCCGHCDVD